MWVKIHCPACQTESSSSWPTASYKGKYRCWKCHGLFAIEVVDGELTSYQPISEAEFEEQKAREEAEKKGLPYTPKPQSAPAAPVTYVKPAAPATPPPPPAPQATDETSTPPPQTPSTTPDFLQDLGKPKAGGVPQGIEYTKPEATETPAPPPKASPVSPQAPADLGLPNDKSAVSPTPSTPVTCINATPTPPPAPKPVEPKAEALRASGKTVKIDAFNFGFIVVNGKQYAYDVIISPDGTVSEREPGRGRIGSHSITTSQIEPLLRASPEVVLVGTGMRGMARLSEQRSSSVDIRVMTSPEAVEEFNKLAAEGKRVATLIHITC